MNLREARFFKKMSQYVLESKTGIRQAKLSLFENGYRTPTKLEKIKIAYVLNCKPDDIFPVSEGKD